MTVAQSIAKLGLALVASAGLAASAVSASAGKPLPGARNAPRNWTITVTRTDRDSYILGNPEAKVRLVEFISYTCPHCAHFEQESADQLKLGMIQPGSGNVEVRSWVRDPVDMTVAVLVRCGPKEKFFANHSAFLRRQNAWIGPLERMSPSQQQRWFTGDLATRMRYIATDFNLYAFMGTLGYDRQSVDRCLADTALADRLADRTAEASRIHRVRGTPTFMIDGVVLAGTTEWSQLRPQLEARLR